MKINYIHEGYFNNPEQMKKQAEKKKEISKAQALANTSNKIVKEGIENFLNAALKRDYEKEFWSNAYEHMYFFPQHIFGKNTQSVIYLSLIDKPKEPEEMFMTKVNLLEIKEDEIDIDIDIRLLCKEALRHIKTRQNSDKILGDSFFKNVNNLTKMKKIAQRHVFDMYTGVRNPRHSYILSDYYSNARNETNECFNIYMHDYFVKNVVSSGANNTIEKFLLDRFNDGTMKFNINKIHLLRGITGDVVLGTDLTETDQSIDPEIGIKYNVASEVVDKFQKLLDLFSFENTGALILRDQYSNMVEAVVKQGGIMNEGFFNNPEQMKKKIEKRNAADKGELVANLADSMKTLLYNKTKDLLETCLNELDFHEYSNRSWTCGECHNYHDVISPYLFGVYQHFFLINSAIISTPSNRAPYFACRYTVDILDMTDDKIVIDVNADIVDEKVLKRIAETNTRGYGSKNDVFHGSCKTLSTPWAGLTEARTTFATRIKEFLAELAKKNIDDRDFINSLIVGKEIYLNHINLFRNVQGDLIFWDDDIRGWKKSADQWYELIEEGMAKMKDIIRIKNSGKFIIRNYFNKKMKIDAKLYQD